MRYVFIRFRSCCRVRWEVLYLALGALSILLCLCWACGAAPNLSGEWESTIAVDLATEVWSLETDVTIGFDIADWMTKVRTLFADGAWKSQEFDVEGAFGAIDISSDLRFEPYLHRFRDWITEFEWESGESAFTLTSKLTRTTDWLILELDRAWDEVEIGASFRLRSPTGSCAFVFYDADVDVAFDWCGIPTDLEIAFDDNSFDAFVSAFSDLAVETIPWITVDLKFTRTATKRTVKLSPDIVLGGSSCVGTFDLDFEAELPSAPHLFPLSIVEASLAWDIADWNIDATAILDPNDWIDDLYWLECEVDAVFDLDPCGEISLHLTFLWNESALGRTRSILTYEPRDFLCLVLEWEVDCELAQMDRLALDVGVAW